MLGLLQKSQNLNEFNLTGFRMYRYAASFTWNYNLISLLLTMAFPVVHISGTLFGNTGTTSLFGQQQPQQQQTTGSLFGQKTGSLFGAPTSGTATTGFGQGFGTGSSLFGQSSSGQTVGSSTVCRPFLLFLVFQPSQKTKISFRFSHEIIKLLCS